MAKCRFRDDVLYQYVGDVKLYQDREKKQGGSFADHYLPRRFAIRRRMVDSLVSAYQQNYDRWYVMAHSLGSVVAFNGLMETAHALPNYLSKTTYHRLPEQLFSTDDTVNSVNVDSMRLRDAHYGLPTI